MTASKAGYRFDASPMKFVLGKKTKKIYFKTVGKPVAKKAKAVDKKARMVVHTLKDGRPLSGVTVTYKNSNTGNTGTRKTGASGKCSDYFGTPGVGYVVTASKSGYKFDVSPMKFILSTKTKK